MEKEHVYLCNLVEVDLEFADVFAQEKNYKNAIHRCETAIYHINQLIKLLKENDEHEDCHQRIQTGELADSRFLLQNLHFE